MHCVGVEHGKETPLDFPQRQIQIQHFVYLYSLVRIFLVILRENPPNTRKHPMFPCVNHSFAGLGR